MDDDENDSLPLPRPSLCSPADVKPTIFSLTPEQRIASGSEWTSDHVKAFRVDQQTPRVFLPQLAEYFGPADVTLSSDGCKRLLESICVIQEAGGGGDQVRRDGGGTPPAPCLRVRRQTQQFQGMVSTVATLSSSPNASLHSSQGTTSYQDHHSVHGSDFDEDESAIRTKEETLTVLLCRAFLRYVLDYCVDDGDVPLEPNGIDFFDTKTTHYGNFGIMNYTAQDDGGIWSTQKFITRQQTGGWSKTSQVALFEAKACASIHKAGHVETSEKMVAQYTAEVVAFLFGGDSPKKVYLISAVQTFICFFCFEPSDRYLEYLCCDGPEQLKANGLENETLTVHSTKWYSLNSAQECKSALRNAIALLYLLAEE
ncbi:hypothetical protein DL766_010024 [Monosporascus sp. MC13-8B]|uniref:Uncharacterized protein n=1 Tax=Monosporascus cannonballus TaxID=155416 RepID=A0ABY0HL51_9PEZI|nr:hypothetical protein DL762_000292 [Monosporascus cannonballus]RYP11648.1 hypothetical protein DL766_010024 [Monosporascus sp. MC13-8B]